MVRVSSGQGLAWLLLSWLDFAGWETNGQDAQRGAETSRCTD